MTRSRPDSQLGRVGSLSGAHRWQQFHAGRRTVPIGIGWPKLLELKRVFGAATSSEANADGVRVGGREHSPVRDPDVHLRKAKPPVVAGNARKDLAAFPRGASMTESSASRHGSAIGASQCFPTDTGPDSRAALMSRGPAAAGACTLHRVGFPFGHCHAGAGAGSGVPSASAGPSAGRPRQVRGAARSLSHRRSSMSRHFGAHSARRRTGVRRD